MTVSWALASCFLIAAVLLLRFALGRKISARLRYALWLVVLVRLLIPAQLITVPAAAFPSASWWDRSVIFFNNSFSSSSYSARTVIDNSP